MYDQAVDKFSTMDIKKSWAKFSKSNKSKKTAAAATTKAHSSGKVSSIDESWEARTILFGFDQSGIAKDDTEMLRAMSSYLKAHANAKMKIFGHTDERGSSEYNIALGWRRALSVASRLESFGVAPKQMEVVSYGKEKPKLLGHNEMAWHENRRVDFNYIG
jgi:peptidoglycan-associated lipoprotein